MSFLAHARSHGLIIKDLIADDRIHAVPTEDHPRKRNGRYRFTGRSGWVQNWAVDDKPDPYRPNGAPISQAMLRRVEKDDREAIGKRHLEARKEARRIINASVVATHPYLVSKGFPAAVALTFDGDLIIPMMEFGKTTLNGLQRISPAGEKKFLPGTKAKGSAFVIGSKRRESWLVEGYGTALSVHAALHDLRREANVIVCFSAGNVVEIAPHCKPPAFIMADNDASQAGEQAAVKTGLPWVMPPEVGLDANDYHKARGLRALCKLMLELI